MRSEKKKTHGVVTGKIYGNVNKGRQQQKSDSLSSWHGKVATDNCWRWMYCRGMIAPTTHQGI